MDASIQGLGESVRIGGGLGPAVEYDRLMMIQMSVSNSAMSRRVP